MILIFQIAIGVMLGLIAFHLLDKNGYLGK